MIELQRNQENTDMLEKSRGREEKSDRAENKLSGFVEQRNYEKGQKEKLSPEEQKRAEATTEQLDGAIQKRDVLSINEIVRNPAAKKLLSPEAIRKAFAVLRSIHMEEAKKHIDTANLGAVRDDITNRLDTVATGYHELFKNLQGKIEATGTLDEESGENLVDLQNEVNEAESSIHTLLRQINTIGNTPTPLVQGVQDMPPEPIKHEQVNNF